METGRQLFQGRVLSRCPYQVVNDAHFGGGADEPGAADPEKRTRQEIMNEVCAQAMLSGHVALNL